MKRFTMSLAAIGASMTLVAGVNAADIKQLPGINKAPTTVAGPIIAQGPAICPNPYDKHLEGVNEAKGEYYCIKANIACPAGFTGSMDINTGKMVCTPIITATCPAGWTGGVVGGQLVCNSIPQPTVACKYSDGAGADVYYKTSWNKMGCMYVIVPK